MKTAFLFPGQGSQYVGMLKDFYEKSSLGKQLIDLADKIVGFKLSEICFEGPLEELKKTKNTQPAIFLHSAVAFEHIKDKIEFHCTAGHSVGEYAALYAAGVLSFEDALRLVALRGKLMQSAGEIAPGTMFAIIGGDDDKIVEICEILTKEGNGNVVVAANFNSPGQIVVSGSAEYLRANVVKFKEAGAKIIKELVVSGAFHSPLMEPARNELASFIEQVRFSDAKVPVYVNVEAKPYTQADELKSFLIAQLTSPVLWTQTIINIQNDGVTNFIEIGPGNVLQGLVKRTVENCQIKGFDKFDDLIELIS